MVQGEFFFWSFGQNDYFKEVTLKRIICTFHLAFHSRFYKWSTVYTTRYNNFLLCMNLMLDVRTMLLPVISKFFWKIHFCRVYSFWIGKDLSFRKNKESMSRSSKINKWGRVTTEMSKFPILFQDQTGFNKFIFLISVKYI